MEQRALKNVNKYLNTNIYSYLETSGGQSSNLYLKVVHFLTRVIIRQVWQLKTMVFLHWCLIRAVLFHKCTKFTVKKRSSLLQSLYLGLILGRFFTKHAETILVSSLSLG